jgi:predicted RNA binding protein YcfA (HicA-like mRNA interferase family)
MFCDNLRALMDSLDMTAKDVANAMEKGGFVFRKTKQPHRTVESWVSKSRPYHPELLAAVALAKVLKTTVIELVDGEAGEQYLREYIREKSWAFSPPERIADIAGALQELSDDELIPIRGAIKAILDKKEGTAGDYGGERPPEAEVQ